MKQNELDHIDKQILTLLQKDASLTSKEIAISLNRSASTINERIHRLQNQGIITHYTAVLNKGKVQDYCIFFTHIQLTRQTKQISENFIRYVVLFPEILTCHQVTGDADFILKVQVKDMPSYYHFLLQKINKISCVGSIRTYMSLSEGKDETTHPIQLLLGFFIFNAIRSLMV